MGLIYETDPAKAQALQSDVLLQSLADNPYFAASSVPTKNAKLATTKQDIIRAINEIVSNFSALKIATDTNVNKVLQALGDFTADTTLLDKLKAIDGNLIEALAKVNTTAQNASTSAESAASRIEIVRQQIEEAGATFEDEQELTEDTNVVKLQYTPVDASKIDLYINGVKYGKKFFTYDADTNSITWINIGKYIGFDLEATDIITAIYSRRS